MAQEEQKKRITIQPGESMTDIAEREYGDANQYPAVQNSVEQMVPGATADIPAPQGNLPQSLGYSTQQPTAPVPPSANAVKDLGYTPQTPSVNTPQNLGYATQVPTGAPIGATTQQNNVGLQPGDVAWARGARPEIKGGIETWDTFGRLVSGSMGTDQAGYASTTGQKEAFVLYESYQKYKDATPEQLFDAIKSGQLTPDPNNALWRAISGDGTATEAMVKAYGMWDKAVKNGQIEGRPGDPYLGGKPKTADEANEILNRGQENGGTYENNTDLTDDEMDGYQQMMQEALSITPPPAPRYVDTLNSLRGAYDLDTLESEVNTLNAEYEKINADMRMRSNYQMDQPVRMGTIAGRVGEVERQERERLDYVRRQIQTKTDQVNSANSVINTMMNAYKGDYEEAKVMYKEQKNQALAVMDSFNVMRKQELDAVDDARDDAKANLTVLYNNFSEGSMSTSTMNATQMQQIAKLEMQAGFPPGTFLDIRSTSPDKELKNTQEIYDVNGNKTLQFVMQDRFTGAISIRNMEAGNDAGKAADILSKSMDISTKAVDLKLKQDDLMYNRPLEREAKALTMDKTRADINKTNLDIKSGYTVSQGTSSGLGGVKATITGTFGQQYGAGVEATKDGKNVGVDFAVPVGTPVSVPQGTWKVVDVKSGVTGGNLKDYKKAPYGNSVMVQNTETGEKMRFSHLSEVGVSKGDTISGGLIGKSGATGNVTGAHLDVEYYNSSGKLADVLASSYGGFYTGEQQVKKNSTSSSKEKFNDTEVTRNISDVIATSSIVGVDGFMSEKNYNGLKQQWVGMGGDAEAFDEKYVSYVNPKYYTSYDISDPDSRSTYFMNRAQKLDEWENSSEGKSAYANDAKAEYEREMNKANQ